MVKTYRKKYLHRHQIHEQEVRTAIRELELTTFTKSWRVKDSEYGMICKFLGRKNDDSNRSKIRGIINYGISLQKKKEKGKRKLEVTESNRQKNEEGPSEHDLIENEEFQEDQKQTLTDEDTSDPESQKTGKRKKQKKKDSHEDINTHTSSLTSGNTAIKETNVSDGTKKSNQHTKDRTLRTMKLPTDMVKIDSKLPLGRTREETNRGKTYKKTDKEYSLQFPTENVVKDTTVTYQNEQDKQLKGQDQKQKEEVSFKNAEKQLTPNEDLLDTNDNHAPTTKAELVGSDTMIQLGRKQEMKKERNMDRKTDKGYSLQFSNDKPDTDINMTDQNDKDNQFKDQEQNTRKEDDFKVSLKKTKGPLAPKGDVTKMKDHYDPSAEEDLVESDSSLPPLKLRRNQHKKNDSKTGSKTGSRTDKVYSLQFSKDKPDTDITMTDQNEKDNQFKDQEQNTRKEDDFKASLEKTKGPLAPKGDVTKMKDHYDPSAEEDLVESDSSLPPLKLRRNQHKTNDSKTGSKTGSRTDKGYSLQFSKDKPDTDITMTDQNEKDNQLKDQEQNTRKEDDFKASLEKTKGPLAPKGDVTKMKDHDDPSAEEDLVESDSSLPPLKLRRNRHKKNDSKAGSKTGSRTDKGYSLQFLNDKPDTDITMTDQNEKDNQLKDQEQNTRKEDDFKASLEKTKGPLAPKGDVTKMKDHYDPSAEEDLVESDSSLPPLKLRRNQHKTNDSKTGSKTGSRTDKGYSLQFSKDKPDTDITMTDQNEKDNQLKDQEQNTRKEDDFKASLEKTKGPLAPKGDVTKMKDHDDPSAEEDLVESDSSLPPLKLRRNRHKKNDSKAGSKTGSRTDKGYSLQFLNDKPDTDITMTDQNEKDNQLKDQEQNTRKEDDFKASLEKTKGPLAPKGDVTKMKDHYDPSAEEDLVESDSSLPPLKLRKNRHKTNDSKTGSKTGSRTDKGYSLQFSKDKPDTDITMTDQNEKDNQFKDQEQNYSITEGDTESETDTESYTYTSNEYFDKKGPMTNISNVDRQQRTKQKGDQKTTYQSKFEDFSREYSFSDGIAGDRFDDISEEGQSRHKSDIGVKKFCKTTLEYAFGPTATNEYFEKEVPTKGEFKIKSSQWQELCKTKRNRCFARGSWEHIISDGIQKTNPYCVYIFRWHKVSIARKKPTKTPLFRGTGECRFDGCKNKCNFSMDKSYKVSLEITSQVKHRMTESHARPISGALRQKTKQEFTYGQKPYKHYLHKIKETPVDVKMAGNFSNFGTTTRTFQQISSESKYQNKLDKSEFESLCMHAQEMKDQIVGKKISGFIQHIAVLPPYIMYWTEMGIRIWHDMAKSSTVYWDATGSILSHRNDNLKYYYYELACVNPVAGQPVIPVSSMISSLHSTALVRFWLAEFRRSEKKIYGHANASIPHQVNSDRSMAFIQASLSEFNNENLNTFRNRAYRIVTGAATDNDFDGTFPHACLSHVMGSFRKIINDHYKTNYDFGMYCFSTLLNSATLTDLEERLRAIYYVLSSTVLDKKTLESIEYIQEKVSTLDIDSNALADICTDSLYSGDAKVTELFTEEINPNFLTEEDFDMRSTRNEFCYVANNILQTVRNELEELPILAQLPQNKRYSPVLLDKIHKLYIPTIPLWTNLLLGDLSRHGTTKVYNRTYPSGVVRGNTKIEKRFQILKHIQLDGKTTNRLDEISVQLKDHITVVQELAVLKSIKSGHRVVTRKGRSTKTIEESWDKKQATTRDSQLIGKYQKTPSAITIKNLKDKSTVTPKKTVLNEKSTNKVEVKGNVERKSNSQNTDKPVDKQTRMFKDDNRLTCNLKDLKNNKYLQEIYKDMGRDYNDQSFLQLVKDSRSGLENVGESCWFNSVVQMFTNTKFMRNINEQFQTELSYEENIRTVLGVFDKVGKGEEVTRGALQNALNDLYTIYGLETEQQHDAHEFVQTAIQHFMELYGEDTYIKVKESYICTSCGNRSGIGEQIYSDLQLSIGDDVKSHEGIQDLLNRYFSDEEIDLTCCEDKKKWRNVRLLNIPADLSICLVRHGIKNNRAVKNSKPISIDRIINMGKYMYPQSDVFYRLTGVVMHHGAGARKGHYTYVKEDGGKPVLFDDAAISSFDSNRILTDGYLFQYELIPDDETICHHSLPNVFHAIKESMGWSEINNSVPFTPGLSVRKNELFKLIEKLEVSDDKIQNSWKIYKLLQESIGQATFYNGADYLEELIKAVLEYFCRNSPNILQRAFGLETIKHAHCASCNFKSTYNQHDIITDIEELKPVYTYLSTASKSTCTVCGKESLKEEKYITNIGSTVIVTGSLDMIYPKSLKQLGDKYTPRAVLSSSGTILFRQKEEEAIPLLLEENGALIDITSNEISSRLQDTTNTCILFLDRKSDGEVFDHLYKLVEVNADFQTDSETLSLSIAAEDRSVIEKFNAPFTCGSLRLDKNDVNRFLHDDFSDKNIDAFIQTLTKEEDCTIMPAAWYHDRLSSLQKEYTWYDKNCIMIPANVRHNHWILIVIRPTERIMYYLDPLAMEPITEVLDRICGVLNNQCVLETFNSVKGHWEVQNLMETGLFPMQRDSSSCGPLTCLYVAMIKGKRSVRQLNVTGIQLRQYILNEIIKSYKEQTEDNSVFGIHNIILTSDLDEIVYNIVTGKQKCNTAHNNFLKNPNAIHRKALIGYGSDFIERDEYYEVESYLFDRYFTQIKKPFRLPNNQCVFDDADGLNKKLQQNFVYRSWYVDCVLVKEVLAEVLGRIHDKSGTEIKRLCIETEFSATEAIKNEIKGFREARKKSKMD